MKPFAFRTIIALLLVAALGCLGFAQGSSSSLTGTVVDQSGGVIPGAEVTVKNDATGTEFKAVTAENGTFSIPALGAGSYTATVSVPNFKQSVIKNIVLVAAVPTNITVKLEVGGSSETVTVVAGAEVVQSTTATVSTTLATTQIQQLPLATRNALDFLVLLPGVNTTGGARGSTFMGLPNSTINITIDGVNTQDNYYRGQSGGDGFFSMITPRLDSVQEVTVSTAAAGADSTGAGAVQIKFVTRSGNNEYHGSLYEYMRNPWLNANYWFNNRNNAPVYQGDGEGRGQKCTIDQLVNEWENCKAPRDRVMLHQLGVRVGGPISIPKLFSGKDRLFFFANWENFRQPDGQTRTRTIYNPLVEQGNYVYLFKQSGQPDQVKSQNLLTLAAANGFTSTMDPTVAKLLTDIRNAVGTAGTIQSYPVVADPLYQNFIFQNKGMGIRHFVTTRVDFNLSSRHKIEQSWNYAYYDSNPDFLNSRDQRYPGFPNYGTQASNRCSTSFALRSTITPRLVNEARGGFTCGTTLFNPNVGSAAFNGEPDGIGDLGGYNWTPTGITGVSAVTSPSRRNAPVKSFEDTLTWTKGAHSLSFGGTFQHVGNWVWGATLAPSIGFGLPSSYDPAYVMFDANNGKINFPNSTASQQSTAASLYASLTARVTAISANAVLSETTNQYTYNGDQVRRARQRSMGLFAADSWRMRPGLTLNFGVRWEVDFPWTPLNNAFTWATPADVWGPSGVNSIFQPGASGGKPTLVYQFNPGDPAYNPDYKSVAPSIGFAWSPQGTGGFLDKILGEGSQTVIRGGFALAFNHYGMLDYVNMFGSNPGGQIVANRSQDLGNLVNTAGGETWPLLFRDKSRLAAPSFQATPVYPMKPSIDDSINAFDPDIRTPYTMSWSFGLQRELGKDMALEIRYAATRNLQPWYQPNLNGERNIVENGFLDEFWKMQGNLYANIAANKGRTFRYDSTVAGTQQLPILLKYLGRGLDPTKDASYTSAVLGSTQAGFFTNTTYVNYLNKYSPDPFSMVWTPLQRDSTRRGNALANGLPANFFIPQPDVQNGGGWIYQNGGGNYYDGMTIELRRRMAKGLLVQANYTFSKALNLNRTSFRRGWVKDLGNTLPHAFKINWVYEMPFGRGRALFGGTGRALDMIVGGWEFQGTARLQSGNLGDFGNINLVGMTSQELVNSVGVYFDDANKIAYYLPKDIIDQTYKAYQYDAGGFTSGAPTGRYIAPAGSVGAANCVQIVSGDCAGRHNYYRYPKFTRFDMSLVKRFRFTEQKNFELRGEFLNAFNNINFNGMASTTPSNLSFMQVNSAYTDRNQTQDPGGRLIQIVLRFNF